MTFATLAGLPPSFNKKCIQGEAERLAILAQAGFHFDPEAARRQLGRGLVSRDDVIDATVMPVTAMRTEEGKAVRLPQGVQQRDEHGLLMEMWA